MLTTASNQTLTIPVTAMIIRQICNSTSSAVGSTAVNSRSREPAEGASSEAVWNFGEPLEVSRGGRLLSKFGGAKSVVKMIATGNVWRPRSGCVRDPGRTVLGAQPSRRGRSVASPSHAGVPNDAAGMSLH